MPAFAGQPEWYSGDVSALRNAATRANQVTTTPYVPYPNNRQRNAPFGPLQNLAFQQGQTEAQNPEYNNIFGQSTGAIRNALGQNISPTLAPYLAGATANPTINAQQYMNPYNEAVTNNIGRLASRNLTENILPQVNDQFIRSGSYGSSGRPGSRSHEDITGRAIRDTQEGVSRAQTEALRGGYNEALNTSVGQQGAQLGAGRVAGNALGLDLERQISGGTALQGLSGQHQGERRQGIGVLSNLGTQQQQQEQAGLNTAFQDFQAEQNFPYLQAARENELLRGLPVSQFTASTNPYVPPLPQPSPWTQGAGLLAGIAGMQGQRQGYAEGGTVKRKHVSVSHLRHYADGGDVEMSPIQKGVNDAMDTSEIQAMRRHAQKLSQERINPMWAGISRAGFNLAANPRLGVLGKLGEAGNAALDEYHAQLGGQDNRDVQASKIFEMIDTTRKLQEERNRNHQLAQEKFSHEKGMDMTRLGMEKERLGMSRESHKHSMENGRIVSGKDGRMYKIGKDEEGKLKATPIEGMEGSNPILKKANEKAAEEVRSSSSSLPELENTVGELKDVSEKLDSGPWKGTVSKYASTLGDIPFIGDLIAAGDSGDVAKFEALTNELVLQLGNQLRGSQVALGKLKMLEKTKPNLLNTREGNMKIIDHIQELIEMKKQKNDYISEALENGKNANEAEREFNQILDEKKSNKKSNSPTDKDIGSLSVEQIKQMIEEKKRNG